MCAGIVGFYETPAKKTLRALLRFLLHFRFMARSPLRAVALSRSKPGFSRTGSWVNQPLPCRAPAPVAPVRRPICAVHLWFRE